MRALLIRYYSDAECTLGCLTFEGLRDPIFWTIELPWLENTPFKSCIPAGEYHVIPYHSKNYKNAFHILGTEPRDGILFHASNWADELEGCIAPGTGTGYMMHEGKMKKCVTSSVTALEQIHQIVWRPEGFDLRII